MVVGKYGLRTEEFGESGRPLRENLPNFLHEERKRLASLRLSGTRLPDDGGIDSQFKKSYVEFAGVIDDRLTQLEEALAVVAELAQGTVRQNQETEELNTKAAQHFGSRAGGTH
jgi:hypothetical protein